MKPKLLHILLALAVPAISQAAGQLTIKATNKLQVPRSSQTIEISGQDLASLGAKSLDFIHVKDGSGKEVLSQAVDADYNELHKPTMLIFQADFAPGETKTFTLTT